VRASESGRRFLRWSRVIVAVALVVGSGLVSSEYIRLQRFAGDLDDGVSPILVLGGSPERVDTALALAGVRAGQRLLIASAGAADDLVAQGGDCEAPEVRCVTPAPLTTRGEARMAAHLADVGDWAGLTVVTSWWHGHRADLHLAACLSIPYRIVVAGDPTASPGVRVIWREALGALDARLRPECRDLAP
jgi:hypothetical protein